MTALLASMHSLWRWTIKLSRNSRHSSMRFRCRRLWLSEQENRCQRGKGVIVSPHSKGTGAAFRRRSCLRQRKPCHASAGILSLQERTGLGGVHLVSPGTKIHTGTANRKTAGFARSRRTTKSTAAWRTERDRRCRSRMRFYQVLPGQCSCTF